MKQITEDYVSYETAKLLKEKGFSQCKKEDGFRGLKYNIDGELTFAPYAEHYRVVTQSIALKWLREVHNLHITIKPYITEEGIMYLFEIYKFEAEKFTLIKTKTGFEKSELANEAALLYVLKNLI